MKRFNKWFTRVTNNIYDFFTAEDEPYTKLRDKKVYNQKIDTHLKNKEYLRNNTN